MGVVWCQRLVKLLSQGRHFPQWGWWISRLWSHNSNSQDTNSILGLKKWFFNFNITLLEVLTSIFIVLYSLFQISIVIFQYMTFASEDNHSHKSDALVTFRFSLSRPDISHSQSDAIHHRTTCEHRLTHWLVEQISEKRSITHFYCTWIINSHGVTIFRLFLNAALVQTHWKVQEIWNPLGCNSMKIQRWGWIGTAPRLIWLPGCQSDRWIRWQRSLQIQHRI